MKYFRNITLCVVTLSMIFQACNDVFDVEPRNAVSSASVFEDLAFARAYLNETYEGVPSGFQRGYYLLDAATDIGEMGYPWPYAQFWNTGSFSPTNVIKFGAPWESSPTPWSKNYQFIFRANDFIANIDRVPAKNQGDEEKKSVLKGEAYFLRALFYHELSNFYGGVPLIARTQNIDPVEGLLTPRSSYEETVSFIEATLDSAIALLPDKRTGADVGRASKAAALALKGRQLLYAEKWAESANASKAVMDLGVHSLFPDYESLFWSDNNNNSEVIFAYQYINLRDTRTHPLHTFNTLPTLNGWGGTQPTQNLVDEYEMVDGLSPEESPLYDPQNPYDNRDPRFGATVFYDGSEFEGEEIELYKGAFQGLGGSAADATETGYFLRKFNDPKVVKGDLFYGYNNWNNIRYAEVLLNFAEAQNEAAGPDQSVYDAVNAVRARASVNMPPLPAGLTQEQMRERIRHERLIELAFEEHRFFDLRRWKDENGEYLANSVLSQPIYGMEISPDRSTYTVFKKEDRTYEPKHRLLPIEQSEVAKYSGAMEQNPGW
jgi:starch-binding outer membrane protein, SusD/RagB family